MIELGDVVFGVRASGPALVPVVVQERGSGAVLMVAWADREALERTFATGEAWFWSRSRECLWKKGETSGNVLRVVDARLDCDGDAILLTVEATGPACHTGSRSCFDRPQPTPHRLELGWLAEVIAARAREPGGGGYTVRLLAEGLPRIAQKVGEEATEAVIAALVEPERVPEEVGDLLYHLLVLLHAAGVPLEDVARVMAERHVDQRRPTG